MPSSTIGFKANIGFMTHFYEMTGNPGETALFFKIRFEKSAVSPGIPVMDKVLQISRTFQEFQNDCEPLKNKYNVFPGFPVMEKSPVSRSSRTAANTGLIFLMRTYLPSSE